MSEVSQAYSPPHTELPSAQAPTNVRFLVLGSLCLLAFILYIDRICISKAALSIERDLGISHSQMSLIFAAFTVAYAVFEVPMGWWGDRYGSRGVLTRIVAWWSIFTGLTGAALGFYSLFAIRFLFGAGEAGALPNTARILATWFPVERRGFAQGMITTSMGLGGAMAPIAAAYLIDTAGWRWAFAIFSLPGIVWALFFYMWYRDDPSEHPGVNAAELELIRKGTVHRPKGVAHPRIPWGLVVRSLNIWLMAGVMICAAFNSYFYFTWYPTFLEQGRRLDSQTTGYIASAVLAAGALGSFCGGFASDWMIRRTGSRRWSRSGLGFFAMASSGILLITSAQISHPILSASFTAGSVLMAFTTQALWWGAVSDVSGRHLGALFGLMNSLGAVGAIASQVFVGFFVDQMRAWGYTATEAWDPLFYVYGCVLFAGSIGWLLINVEQSVDTPAT